MKFLQTAKDSKGFHLTGALFRTYRLAIAPLLGPGCRYEPSCSRYAEEAIARWGFIRGVFLATWRILRCHPFARGGVDNVPARMIEKNRNTAGDL